MFVFCAQYTLQNGNLIFFEISTVAKDERLEAKAGLRQAEKRWTWRSFSLLWATMNAVGKFGPYMFYDG